MTCRTLVLVLAAQALVIGSTAADTIRLLDGKAIENVQVVSEGLKEVSYKDKDGNNKKKTVPSDQVLRVEFEKLPKEVGDAEGYLAEEDLERAVGILDAYVQALIKDADGDKEDRDQPHRTWLPAYAAWRALEVRTQMADLEGVKSSAVRLIQSYPDARYVPLAYLAKAGAELQGGQVVEARKTLGELSALISTESLPRRWQLECRLAQLEADDGLKPEAKHAFYEGVASEAQELTGVALRAQVLVGEAYLAESLTNPGGAKGLCDKAKAAFEKVLASPNAPRDCIAAAHAGLGESLFLLADGNDRALLQEAVLQFLRVTTVYRDNGRYVSKSLFYAMRCFDLMQVPARKADMKKELATHFPSSTWAAEAKRF